MPDQIESRLTTPHRYRVAIIDDHALLLDGLTTWVRSNARDMEVVISVAGWFDLIRSPEFPPDIVIMDYQLREPVSIETRVRTCLAAGSLVVVVSALETREIRERSLAAGASEFVSKAMPAEEVVAAARAALHVRDDDDPLATTLSNLPHGPSFSAEEIETLRLYAGGNSPVDIALRMGLPFESVKAYLARVREYYAAEGRPAETKQDLIRRVAEDGFLA